MNKLQKIVLIFIGIIISGLLSWNIYEVDKQSKLECIYNYYIGTIIDKAENTSYKGSSYRWIIADWTTKDGKHIGREEINASGIPINSLNIGDNIYANGENMKPFTWFNLACGNAYYPTQLNVVMVIIAMLTQMVIYIILIVILVKCGVKLWNFLGMFK